MKIAVLSGKGGTGKTLLSVNLAASINNSVYMDCDVEEPNGHLYFKPEFTDVTEVKELTPVIDMEKCTLCRKCSEFCAFNAIAFAGKKSFVFSDVCHGCGGCKLVCPVDAIGETSRVVGCVKRGKSKDVRVLSGMLSIGEASGMPIIAELRKDISDKETVIIDCPPGCGCNAMDCVRYADICVLVAEPTIFGAQNLEMVYELVKMFDKPVGVVLNKCGEGENPSEQFCKENGIEILGRIPFEKELGLIHSEAKIAVLESDKYKKLFSEILGTARRLSHG